MARAKPKPKRRTRKPRSAGGRSGRGVLAAAKRAIRRASGAGGAARVAAAALMREAERARTLAYAPYSGFAVGAALLTASGRVARGCNVENASFGLTNCAERSAVFAAVSAGEREFVALAIAGPPGPGAPPCGACRQVLMEFAPLMTVYFRDAKGRVLKRTLGQLLPDSFALGGRPRR